jgi:4-alpha-glucanotransferase
MAVPVFSLRSVQSLGCGEFLDICALVDWAVACGLSVLQVSSGNCGRYRPYTPFFGPSPA